MRKIALGLLAAWTSGVSVLALAPAQSHAASPSLHLQATTASEWAQSPKLSPDGQAIAYIVSGPDGHQRVEVRSSAKSPTLSAKRNLSPEIRAYWLNWIGDDQLDVRVSDRDQPSLLQHADVLLHAR